MCTRPMHMTGVLATKKSLDEVMTREDTKVSI